MTAEEIFDTWYEECYIGSIHGMYKNRLIDLITAYGLQKQNEVLDKAAEVMRKRSTPIGMCSCDLVTPILNLKNKL